MVLRPHACSVPGSFPVPQASESARIARGAARDGQGLPRRFWPVAATGLLPPDLVAILVGEPRELTGSFHLPLDDVPRDGLAADEARASGAPSRDRHGAGGEQPAIREPLTDALPQRLGGKIAAARDAARGPPTRGRAMRSRAEVLTTPRSQHEEQPSDIARCVHESCKRQALCRSEKDPGGGTYVDGEPLRPSSRKECPPREGRRFRACGRSRSAAPLRVGQRMPEFFVPALSASHRRILRVGGP